MVKAQAGGGHLKCRGGCASNVVRVLPVATLVHRLIRTLVEESR